MKRRLSYAQSLKAAPYHAFYSAAHNALSKFGRFSHEAILKETKFDCFRVRDIHWPLVARRLEENGWGKLIGASGAFFQPHTVAEEIDYPSRFVAGAGKGQYIAGYFVFSQQTQHLVDVKFGIEEKIAVSADNIVQKTQQTAIKVGLHLVSSRVPPVQGMLPLVEITSEAKTG